MDERGDYPPRPTSRGTHNAARQGAPQRNGVERMTFDVQAPAPRAPPVPPKPMPGGRSRGLDLPKPFA